MSTSQLTEKQIDAIIDLALDEDTGHGDITSEALLPPDLNGKASLLVKEKGVLAGIDVAGRVFQRVDPSLETDILIKDGTVIQPGDVAGRIVGQVTSILKAERVALNFLQRLSGIASLTAQYVAAIHGLPARIVDTRKTTPGMRRLEKYAVRMGGGHNHRLHLGEAVLIKDNHIAALRATGLNLKDIVARARQNAPAGVTVEVEVANTREAMEALKAGADIIMLDNMSVKDNHIAALRATGLNLKDIVARARQNAPAGVTVEVEVANTREAMEALKAGADIIMLDNMSVKEMRQVVNQVSGQAKLEASGGITLANVRQVAMTGVDIISIGALTHSSRALDISLELESPTLKLL